MAHELGQLNDVAAATQEFVSKGMAAEMREKLDADEHRILFAQGLNATARERSTFTNEDSV